MGANHYYVLSGSSNEAADPVTWRVAVASEGEIIAQAEEECRSTGEDLEFFAGFELIGTSKSAGSIGAEALTWSRDWLPGEKFKASLLKLEDEGRSYQAFNAADPVQVRAFLEQAASVGLGADAEALHSMTSTLPPLCKRGARGD